MPDMIFQVSDLAQNRLQVLKAARAGGARVRDKDGLSLIMLPEGKLELLEELVTWNAAHLRLEELLARGVAPSVSDLGDLAWLRVFDSDELKEFLDELHRALTASHADGTLDALRDCITAWRTTARQLDDPLRRSILRSPLGANDFVEVERPDGNS
ncbi:MAG TPA: hypothetical protein VG317_04610 [Pseudonocardiaceae bacterium]|jgi:hypothetical protein|nr:hypothetical protein [Pseudonocardiaceae bacterium]